MYGEVYVEYTGIGGTNLDSGIMTADITGSSADASGSEQRTINITWSLPGGITNRKNRGEYQGAEWGYLFGNRMDVQDEDVVARIQLENSNIAFDSDYNLMNPVYESEVESMINNWVYDYAGRALHGQGSDWGDFRNYFGDGICVHIIY